MTTVTGKKAQFVEHYIECRDPILAAERAGFSVPLKQGPLLMRNADIRTLIDAAPAPAAPLSEQASETTATTASTEQASSKTPEATAPESSPPGLSPSQREACLHMLLRDTHETTEHYRAHRPEVFTGVTFTPGATETALRRRGSVQRWVVGPAAAELLAKGWIEIAARTAEDGPTPAGESIYRPTQLGLDTLTANDESRWTELREIVKRAGAFKPPRRPRVRRPDRRHQGASQARTEPVTPSA